MKSTQSQSVFAPSGASVTVKALCLISCLILFLFAGFASGQASPVYGDCSVTTVGTPTYGPNPLTGQYGGALNGFLPFPSDFILNQNISSAAVDPNSAVLITNLNSVSHNNLHILIGSSPADGSIPYYITDSSVTPKIEPIVSGDGLGEGEGMVIAYPNNDAVPIEDDSPDCSIWPDTDSNDQHSLVLDRNGCWLYEIWVTSRCPGSDLNIYYQANSVTLFDATRYNARPWGFTSSEAGGLSVYGNTLKYDEAASGVIKHAIRFTVPTTAAKNLFVIPATHGAASKTAVDKLPEGAVLRLNPSKLATTLSTNTSGFTSVSAFSTMDQTIITALENYGMVMSDNGSNMYLIGDTDPRWNDNDLGNLKAIFASDFDVIQMYPDGPTTTYGPGYMDENTAASTYYPDTTPLTITSFTASVNGGSAQTGNVTVPAGGTVTFNFCVSGTNYNETYTATNAEPYVYIDNVGPARLTAGCGSLTTKPTVTQEYTFYALNTQVNAVNDGMPPFSTINLVVTGAPIIPAQVVFIPPPTIINGKNLGYTYAADTMKVTPVTSTWSPQSCGGATPGSCNNDNYWGYTNATYYYTTATGTSATLPVINSGTTPTTGSTMLSTSTNPPSITVTKSSAGGSYGYEVICAIATVPAIGSSYGSSHPSTNSCATYIFTGTASSYADAPIILPPSGTYNTPQLVSMASPSGDESAASAGYNTILYTTDGSTPTTATGGAAYSTAPALPTMVYAQGQDSSCYGSNYNFGVVPSCNPSGLVYATNGMTIKALAATATKVSTVTTNTYTINTANPVFSPAAGDYVTSVTVTISDASSLATIYFTTDGTTPTSSSATYSEPIEITTTTYLQAIAEQTGGTNSGVTPGIYSIEIPAALTTPTPNTPTPLSGTSVAFTWTPGNVATHYMLYVGNTGAGSSNLYNSGNVTVLTETVSDLPTNGQTVNVRLYSLINGSWNYVDYTYVAYGTPTPAALTTPTPNTSTPLTGTSVAFAWTPGNTATHFEFIVGTTVGSSNIYSSGSVTATTETVSGLPNNGETIHARLYSLIDGAWQYTDYTYVAHGSPVPASLTTPTPNTSTPLTGTSVAFSWTPGNTATQFQFWVGSNGAGSSNLYNSGSVTATTETVSDLPNNDSTVNVRLYSLINGAWQYSDYTYVSAGTATPAALTTPTPNTPTPLTGTSVAFSWTPGNSATHFQLWVGSTGVGSSNLYNSGSVTATTETVSTLPNNDSTVYVRLYSLVNGAWAEKDYTYVSAGTAVPAAISSVSPVSGTQFLSASETFDWTPGNSATHFMLYLGTSVGSSNLYNSGNVTVTTETVGGLPTNGEPIYARLYSLVNGAWQYANYTYTAF